MFVFAMFTEDIDRLCLQPVSTLLLSWLLKLKPPGTPIEFALDDFQEYSSTSRRKAQGYSKRQIKRGLDELIEKEVLDIDRQWWGGIYRVMVRHPNRNPKEDSASAIDAKTASKKSQTSKSVTQMSKTGASKSDSAVPINREYLETTDTPTHNHPVLVQEFDNEGTSSASKRAIADGQHKVTEGISEPHEISTCDAPKIPKNETIFSEEIKIAPEDSVPDPPVPAPCELETPAPAPVRRGGIDPQLRREVEAAIAPAPLNANLRKVIEEAEPQVVRDAIAVLQENRDRGQVRRPAGMLTMAIRGRWVPNEETSMIPEGFSEWFDLARQKGIVAASTMIAGQMMVCIDLAAAKWKPWTEISAVFTMGYLQRMHPIKGM